jgi:hypothetical protein
MASDDFLELTNLVYTQNWRPKKYEWRWNKDRGYSASVTLERDGDVKEFSSTATDCAVFIAQIQRLADSKGKVKLEKIRDTNKYWEDVTYLLDENGEKLRAALELIAKGAFQFDFDPFAGIRKILQDKIPVNDPDVRGVKSHYFETLAFVLLSGRSSVEIKEKTEKNNPKFASYYGIFEKLLRKGFMPDGKDTEPVRSYRRFLDFTSLDMIDLGRRVTEQERYTDFLAGLLIEKGRVEIENGVRAIVDIYWRMCEVCYPMLNALRVAIELSKSEKPSAEKLTFEDLVASLREDADACKLVECVEPLLRNCEAHCATSVRTETSGVYVVTYETRTPTAREISKMPFSEVDDKTKCLKYSLVPVLYVTLALFEYAFQIITLTCYEFKLLLITLSQY